MSTTEIIILIVVVLVLLAVVGYVLAQKKKSKQLRSKFGPEYDRTVEGSGRRRDAERELAERQERRQQLDIRPLPEQDRQAFADRWRSTQEDFVDRPSMAVRQADLLVAEVMGRRGYPVGDFDQQARDVSVDHASVVHEYRAAHEISQLNDRDQASTEQLRQAMVHYRALFTELLEDNSGADDRHDDSRDDRHGRDDHRDDRDDDRLGSPDDRRDDSRDDSRDDRRDDSRDDRRGASDAGYATDEDGRTPRRTVVEGGLNDRSSSDRSATDRPRDVRP